MSNFFKWVTSLSGPFPNSEIGMFVARKLLLRGLQLSLNRLVYITPLVEKNTRYQAYFNDARGPKAMVEVWFLVSFTTSESPVKRVAFACLLLSCDSPEHLWGPNPCGSYICIDGKEYLHLEADHQSENISLGVEGMGSHVPDEFREKASQVPWEASRQS